MRYAETNPGVFRMMFAGEHKTEALEEAGTEIIACGTCLNFFELTPKLMVGRGTDMLEIAGLLARAGHIVRP